MPEAGHDVKASRPLQKKTQGSRRLGFGFGAVYLPAVRVSLMVEA